MYCLLYLNKKYFPSFSNPVLWEKCYLSSQYVFSQLIKLVTIFDYMHGMFVWHMKDKYSSSCIIPFNITHPKEVVLVALALTSGLKAISLIRGFFLFRNCFRGFSHKKTNYSEIQLTLPKKRT